ncbi:MAG: hypothetical protein Dasosvirus12_4 [Dasosvirus sp.]|uniref:Uncharacterized protein n=1 Tax=Dasosvirus sp. TaxID=2487764 RepID=A0A3G4ZRR9_9VIRU|nr:MAG: hypothetical protein Dasosvirus12_4 [Dasosvirus sp.]
MNYFRNQEGELLLEKLEYHQIVSYVTWKQWKYIELICHTANYSTSDAYKYNYKYLEEYCAEESLAIRTEYLRVALCVGDLRIVNLFKRKYNNIWKNANSDLLMNVFYLNTNLEVIKFIMNEFPTYYLWTHFENKNYLQIACLRNTLENIKYLVQQRPSSLEHIGDDGSNSLLMACHSNTLDVVKYLYGECKQKLNCHNLGIDYLGLAFYKNNNYDVIKYLIDECQMDIQNIILPIYFYSNKIAEKLCHLISMFHENYVTTNNLLDIGLQKSGKFDVNVIVKHVKMMNPLMIKNHIRLKFGIRDPFLQKYKTFVQYVDWLHCIIPSSDYIKYK